MYILFQVAKSLRIFVKDNENKVHEKSNLQSSPTCQ